MKFGRNLPRNQVLEWASFYINYNGLKKLIKGAAEAIKAGQEVNLTEFSNLLGHNLEDVDNFYNKKFSEYSGRLKLLEDRYGKSTDIVAEMDPDEVEELMGVLLELRGQLRKLQWFGEVNRRGFLKITKKLEKKVPIAPTQQRYVEDQIDPKPFATNTALSEGMRDINSWLSILRDAQNQDDARSTHSVHSLKRVSSVSILDLPAGLLDTLDKAVRNDDASILEEALMEANLDPENPAFQMLQLKLLHRSISSKSRSCIDYLLRHVKSLDDADDISQRNCLHRLAISIGRSNSKPARLDDQEANPEVFTATDYILPAANVEPIQKDHHSPEVGMIGMQDESVQILAYVLDHIQPGQRGALVARDTYGRLPLHYGAQRGVVIVCQLLTAHMQEWDQFNTVNGIDASSWQDNENLAPLHLSVIGGHPLTAQVLLDAENWQGMNDKKAAMKRRISQSSAVLALATKLNFVVIVKLLVDAGFDINWQDDQGETALHVAARFGHSDCAQLLLEGNKNQKANVELVENTFSWTPLHIASVDGHLQVAELLVAAGAKVDKIDALGWTAREHAALRGHMDIAQFLADVILREKHVPEISSSTSEASVSAAASSPPLSIEDLRSQNNEGHEVPRGAEPVKTFGHRHLINESMVLVNLGSMDSRKNVEAVKLDRISIADAHSTQLDTALSLVVSTVGAQGEKTIIDLPVQEGISTEPITFTALDVTKVILIFDIVPTYGGHEKKVGRAVALLNSVKPTIGVKRMNLQGDLSVPIMAATTLEVIGCVNFSFLIITPFSHPNMEVTEKQTYWKSMSSTMVIGHRGLGKNVNSDKPQLGENTIQSFIAAEKAGADYVEFDVQLTKDHVPVIYHDFLVSETGIDAPVHTITLEQFLHLNDRRLSRSPLGKSIQAPFTTLEETFKKVPEKVGFNIEMKYPMLFESEEQEMDTYAVELNTFCDSVLNKVYDLRKERNIIFSSFHPDMCILLALKQPSIPILFLTDAGICAVGDVRASSLQEAIRFAVRWNLLGIVSAAQPFCNSPRLIKVVKENGLVCMSYGELNNEPVTVQPQVEVGIDAVIVDRVDAIRKSLQQKKSKEAIAYQAAASAEIITTLSGGAAMGTK